MSSVVARLLVLWDVDHTLMESGGLGRRLYQRAFEVATGQPFEHRASVTGSTELRILAETLELHGVEPSRDVRAAYVAALTAGYRDSVDELRGSGRALAGAREALEVFAGLGAVQTVVTGNLRAVAEVKLQVFGLDRHLDLVVGAFAEDHERRDALVATAIDRARRVHGVDFAGRIVMFGDTPADVRAGLANDVPVIGVATGRSSSIELAREGASATLSDLADADLVRAVVNELASS